MMMDDVKRNGVVWGIGLTLVVLVFSVYAQTLSFSFISFDDAVMVVDNPSVNQGLTLEGLVSVLDFKRGKGPYWHPVTSISHMLDCSLFGLDPGLHHLSNLLFHALNTLVLFLFLARFTGETWKSAFVAALFAVHPLNVETVAWISERKNLLATLFFLTGLWVYAEYVRKWTANAYTLLVLVFTAGLMSKPIMMTFPFTLFLVHHWPLKAYDRSGTSVMDFFAKNRAVLTSVLPLILGMLALFLIAVGMGRADRQLASYDHIPLALRLSTMLTADLTYLIKMVAPLNLTVFHPYPETLPLAWTLAALVFLGACSIVAVVTVYTYPYVFVGWFWYVGNLVTASGLMQQGYFPSHADRFTYMPMIGLFIILGWGIPDLFGRMNMSKKWLAIPAVLVIAALSVLTVRQASHWKNGISLFSHAVSVNPKDVVSMTNLALSLGEAGRLDEAMEVSYKALELEPRYAEALNNLGTLYAKKGRIQQSLAYYDKALEVYPGFLEAKTNRHMALGILERNRKKEEELRKQLEQNPSSLTLSSALASVLVKQEKYTEAEELYRSMLVSHPEAGVSITYNLACLNEREGKRAEALLWLEDTFSRGFTAWEHLEKDPDLRELRATEGFLNLVRKFKGGGSR